MCFLGVDIGGTSVRSLVTDASGKILGYQRIARVSCESLWQAINDCLGAVLAQSSVVHVEAAVVGAAGAGPAGNQYVCRSVEKAFGAVGLDVTPQVVTDIEIAYWSAAALGDGSILVAGTGAIAGRFSEWRCVDRRDGAGWLLGDHGSGYWIGRKALRAAAADLDRRGPSTAITRGLSRRLDCLMDVPFRISLVRRRSFDRQTLQALLKSYCPLKTTRSLRSSWLPGHRSW